MAQNDLGAPVYIVNSGTSPIPTTGGGSGGTAGQVQGNAASGATDVGNPVKVGGVFNTTLPILTTGQRGDAQLDVRGNLRTQPVLTGTAATDGINNASGVGYYLNRDTTGALLPLSGQYIFNGTSWDRTRGDTTGTYVVSKGTPNMATGQVASSISPATSIQIVAARAGRQSVIISNVTGTQPVYFTTTAVTTGATTGFFLAGVAGASITIPTSGAIFATSPTAAQTLSFMENY